MKGLDVEGEGFRGIKDVWLGDQWVGMPLVEIGTQEKKEAQGIS